MKLRNLPLQNSFFEGFSFKRKPKWFRVLCAFVALAFLETTLAQDVMKVHQVYAQMNPALFRMVSPSASFTPPLVKAIHVDPLHPFEMDFVLDASKDQTINEADATRLIKYFLAIQP
jgi:hypothetical protein